MTVKWDAKKAMDCLTNRKNPFGETKSGGKGIFPGIIEKIKDIAIKNREVA